MTYSLISMPVLGYDLCRLPRAVQAADILLRVLSLQAPDLATVAEQHPGVEHHHRWRRVQSAGWARPEVTDSLRWVAEAGSDKLLGSAVTLLHALERSTLGDLNSLVRLVSNDILDWTWSSTGSISSQDPTATAAVDVVCAALAAEYCSEILPGSLAAQLREPWSMVRLVDRPMDLGPTGAAVERLLERIATLDAGQREALRAAVADGAERPRWAAAVHDASWAVYLTDRIRPAAVAQLLAVRAFRTAGFTSRDGAYGVWNCLSGLVQSVVVADLLESEAIRTLRRAWDCSVGD
jgi:hypothetical protein